MKIVIVIGFFNPNLGYQEKYIAKYLTMQGHQVTVLTSDAALLDYEMKEINLPLPYDIKRLKHYFFLRKPTIVLCKGYKRILQNIKPDIVISFGIAQLFPFLVSLYSEKIGSKIIGVFGDNPFQTPLNRSIIKDKLFKKIKFTIYQHFGKISNLIVYNTHETLKILTQVYKNMNVNYYEFPLGFDPEEKFFDSELRKNTRKKLGIKDNEVCIVTSGRPSKGERFIKVAKLSEKLLESGFRIKTLLIGASENDILIKSKFRENIRAVPFSNTREFNAYLNAADIGIWDKPTISIKEAVGTGLFVLYPKCLTLQDLIDNKIGMSIKYGDIANSKVVEKLLYNKSIKNFRERRYKRALSIYSYELLVSNFLNYIRAYNSKS